MAVLWLVSQDTPTYSRLGTQTNSTSKKIAVSDEVYRRLERETGDRSFSEVIEAHLDAGGRLTEVAGECIFESGTYESVEGEIARLSDEMLEGSGDESR